MLRVQSKPEHFDEVLAAIEAELRGVPARFDRRRQAYVSMAWAGGYCILMTVDPKLAKQIHDCFKSRQRVEMRRSRGNQLWYQVNIWPVDT